MTRRFIFGVTPGREPTWQDVLDWQAWVMAARAARGRTPEQQAEFVARTDRAIAEGAREYAARLESGES